MTLETNMVEEHIFTYDHLPLPAGQFTALGYEREPESAKIRELQVAKKLAKFYAQRPNAGAGSGQPGSLKPSDEA